MKRKSVSISVPAIWTDISTQSVHKIDENSNNKALFTRNLVGDIHRRSIDHGKFYGIVQNAHKHHAKIINRAWLNNQLGKVKISSISNNQVSGDGHKLLQHDLQGSKGQVKGNKKGSLFVEK